MPQFVIILRRQKFKNIFMKLYKIYKNKIHIANQRGTNALRAKRNYLKMAGLPLTSIKNYRASINN